MPTRPKPISRYSLITPTYFRIFIPNIEISRSPKQCLLSSFHCSKKSKFRSLSLTWQKFSILELKIHGLKQNQDLGISTLVHPTFYSQNGFRSKFTTLVSLNKKKKGFCPKTARMRRLVDTCTNRKNVNHFQYFQNRREATFRRYLQNPKKSWRRNISVDIHKLKFQKFEKTKTKISKVRENQNKNRGDSTL